MHRGCNIHSRGCLRRGVRSTRLFTYQDVGLNFFHIGAFSGYHHARSLAISSESDQRHGISSSEDVESCPLFASRPPPDKVVKAFRIVPKSVIDFVHTWFFVLVGGRPPPHLAIYSMSAIPPMEIIYMRLAARLVAMFLALGASFSILRRAWSHYHNPASPEDSDPGSFHKLPPKD